MSDLIEREVAIDRLNSIRPKRLAKRGYQYGIDVGISMCIVSISEQPTAQPELDEWCTDCKEYDKERHSCPRWNRVIRETVEEMKQKTGKWEAIEGWDGDVLYRCSECGTEFMLIDGTPEENDYHFCPHCGADMRGEQNDRIN